MKTKTKTITVVRCIGSEFDEYTRSYKERIYYRVERVTDSVEYHVGGQLPIEVVKELCELDDWKVAIVANPKM